MRNELASLASHTYMQVEREPSFMGFKSAQGKALRADLRVVVLVVLVEGQSAALLRRW